MKENFENLDSLSIEELERTIEKAQALVQEKQQEAQCQAELERQCRQRLEVERKKQEEITRLQQRLRELQGESPEPQQGVPKKPAAAATRTEASDMVACPQCHKLLPVDSKFCFYCGSTLEQKTEQDSGDVVCRYCSQAIPADSQFCPNCGRSVGTMERPTAAPQNAQSMPQSTPQPGPQLTHSNLPVDEDAFRKYVSSRFLYIFIGICVLTIFLWFSMSSDALFVFAGMMVFFGIPYLIGKNRISRFIAKMQSNGTYEPVLREFVSASSVLDDKVRYSENYIFQKGSIKFYAYQDICWIYRSVRKFLFIPYISSAMVGDRTGIVAPFCSLKIGNQAGREELQTLAALIRAKNPGLLLGFDPATQREYHSRYHISKR